MRWFLLAFFFSSAAFSADYKNSVGYTDSAYNSTYIVYRFKVKVVSVGKLPAGYYTFSGTSRPEDPYNSVGTSANVGQDGVLPNTVFQVESRSPHTFPYYGSFPVLVSATTPTGNIPPRVVATTSRVDRTGDQGGNPKFVYKDVIYPLYPPDRDRGAWNVELVTRSRADLPLDYCLQWAGKGLGSITRIPAAVPSQPALVNWSEYDTTENLPAPRNATLWRRSAGGSWVVVKSVSVPYNSTVTINDDPGDPVAAPPEDNAPTTTPPPSAAITDSNGSATGDLVGTGGNGYGGGGAGGSGGTGGTGGSGGAGGAGGNGATGVYDDVLAALNDSGAASATPTTAGLNGESLDPVETSAANTDGLESSLVELMGKGSEVRGLASGLVATQIVTLPSVSGRTYELPFNLPTFQPRTIDFSGYATQISFFRGFVLLVVIIIFNVMAVRLIRATFG